MNITMSQPPKNQHVPVMCERAVSLLGLKPGATVVDATFGRGGHSARILQQIGGNGRLFALDRDVDAIKAGEQLFSDDRRVTLMHVPFANMQQVLQKHDVVGEIDAVLFDLGVSSPQLDQAERGFSFMRDGPLDMRMNQQAGMTAYEWLCQVEEADLARVLKRDGEERFARKIANRIKQNIHDEKYNSTLALANLISEVIPNRHTQKIHPATRTFQAIRIAINAELTEIKNVLPQVLEVLKPGGRVVVISFHSLEDRLVKRFFVKQSKGDDLPPEVPVKASEINPRMRLLTRAVKADDEEIEQNRRARSAVMRAAEKVW